MRRPPPMGCAGAADVRGDGARAGRASAALAWPDARPRCRGRQPAPAPRVRRTVSAEIARQLHAAGARYCFTVPGESDPAAPRRPRRRGHPRRDDPARVRRRLHGRGAGAVHRPSAARGRRHARSAPPTPPSASTPPARTRRPLVVLVGQVERPYLGREAFQESDLVRGIGSLAAWASQVDDPTRPPAILAKRLRRLTSGPPGTHPPVAARGRPGRGDRGRRGGARQHPGASRTGGRPRGRAPRRQAAGGIRAWRHRGRGRGAARSRHQAPRGALGGAGRARHRRLAATGRLPQRPPQLPGHGRALGGADGPRAPRGCRRHRLHRGPPVGGDHASATRIPRSGHPLGPRRPPASHGPRGAGRAHHRRRGAMPHASSTPPGPTCARLRSTTRCAAGARPARPPTGRPIGRPAGSGQGTLGAVRASIPVASWRPCGRSCRTTPSSRRTPATWAAGWLAAIRFRRAGHLPRATSGAMGFGLPAAIAASLHDPDRIAVAICGDGGFAMSMMELETAVREGAHPIVLVFDNERYGTIATEPGARRGAPRGRPSSGRSTSRRWLARREPWASRVADDADFEPALARGHRGTTHRPHPPRPRPRLALGRRRAGDPRVLTELVVAVLAQRQPSRAVRQRTGQMVREGTDHGHDACRSPLGSGGIARRIALAS